MRKFKLFMVLVFILTSFHSVRSFAQTSDLATVLGSSKVVKFSGFKENILPYINFESTSKEKMHVESHVLSSDMTIQDLILTFGIRALDASDMVPMLTNALVNGNLKGIRLLNQNLFVVLINQGDYGVGYFVTLFWLPSNNCWALDAHQMGSARAKKGAQIFNSY